MSPGPSLEKSSVTCVLWICRGAGRGIGFPWAVVLENLAGEEASSLWQLSTSMTPRGLNVGTFTLQSRNEHDLGFPYSQLTDQLPCYVDTIQDEGWFTSPSISRSQPLSKAMTQSHEDLLTWVVWIQKEKTGLGTVKCLLWALCPVTCGGGGGFTLHWAVSVVTLRPGGCVSAQHPWKDRWSQADGLAGGLQTQRDHPPTSALKNLSVSQGWKL